MLPPRHAYFDLLSRSPYIFGPFRPINNRSRTRLSSLPIFQLTGSIYKPNSIYPLTLPILAAVQFSDRNRYHKADRSAVCPFGVRCFYAHLDKNGRDVKNRPPPRTRRQERATASPSHRGRYGGVGQGMLNSHHVRHGTPISK